ncbi:secreted RxLR effector protein 161-like [Leptopilina heterotoma]|uniref:secreted RxLR effector protein 161-like n=1 Tax=Leptopilina heterotoma TaxID=63436 RepID=UPI001CA9665F|nr:secreted RxLR effector protein 161-like [Leptopilina heterotoma]
MQDSKPVSTPMRLGEKLAKPENCSSQEQKKYLFRELIGALFYLVVGTRPDIAYTRISDLGLKFVKTGNSLHAYVDADWANCVEAQRSYTAYVFILAGMSISWEVKKQVTFPQSSLEAEYMGLTEASKEAIY